MGLASMAPTTTKAPQDLLAFCLPSMNNSETQRWGFLNPLELALTPAHFQSQSLVIKPALQSSLLSLMVCTGQTAAPALCGTGTRDLRQSQKHILLVLYMSLLVSLLLPIRGTQQEGDDDPVCCPLLKLPHESSQKHSVLPSGPFNLFLPLLQSHDFILTL